ncbi:hypothetical protein DWV48_04445 [Collinsella sp. AF08-23]|nr:hypothetical protein [Collinsella stercoris]RHS40372.1 hypothetical protein DWV48_04445 [Collinsella sp. AF08-23]
MSASGGRFGRTGSAVSPVASVSHVVERVRAWWYGGSVSAAIAWTCALVALAALLVWFFICSPYGAPASPVYAEF